jgi:CheY-like chemotaxis protein
MGGRIGVESEPGAGSKFWFEACLGSSSASEVAASVKVPFAIQTVLAIRPERILLVEDNEITTVLAKKHFLRLGFEITSVTDGRSGVAAVSSGQYDIVFMDCHMPEMDGLEATAKIRELEAGTGRRVPIVAMTADARIEDRAACIAAGMDDYLSKPWTLADLAAVLDRWLPTASEPVEVPRT